MKYFISALALFFSLSLLSCSENKVEISDDQVIGMRTTAMEFMKDLKSVLVSQIQTKGVLQAVSVCSDTAQVLTNNFGIQKGVFIKRVSFKNRNENNFPDDFEKKILNKFEMLHQNKELNSETEHAEIVKEGEYKYLRYLKPILVQAECLNCHGSETDIMPEVKQLIEQEYSDDKAVGYLVGDLRGAVSLKKVIE
jgi:Protein of unknown function (DUF3365)